MPSGRIRQALPIDARCIAAIHRQARMAAMPWLPDLHTPEEDEAYFSERVLPAQTVLIADDGDAAAAFIAFADGWVHHLYVAPQHWARGYGSALLGRAKSAAPQLQLWAFQGNLRARRFYARHGFQEVELTDGVGNDEKTPDVRLVWVGACST